MISSKRLLASYITRKNYYEIIGVPATATRLEIRDAFLAKTKQLKKTLKFQLHPDQSSSQNSKKDSRVGWRTGASETEQFMLVKEAYDVLRNEEKRKEYDMATSREGGFLMEATLKTQQMSTQRRNIQRAEWSADVIPDARKKSKTTVYSHFRNPEEEYLKEKRKNRLLGVLAATVMALIAANILYIRRLQARRLLEDSQPVR
ncbi:CRE-DNJ-3 protein [Caenorhabditis remanei]|uniref:CRE-DNJ-3 protein n=1 Tax=Caenorhabditis remanei TaxID=31234 RepID=E3NCI7_CAERE|nr:CRE-DNJ-3 protein [Caenorhabditis remanei]